MAPVSHARWLLLAAATLVPVAAHCQTADPTAAAPNPVTAAPPARTGSYTLSQGRLLVAPGLAVPNGNVPWALDTTDTPPALIPIHHSSITEPSLPGGSTPSPTLTHTLQGAHAKTLLRTASPTFFLHTNDRTENTGDAGRGNPTGWALVQATAQGNDRVIPNVRFESIAQGTACAVPLICLQAEALPDGWLRLTAAQPLPPGDYALVPVPRQPQPGILILYDFLIDPAAGLPRDAVRAGAPPLDSGQHTHHAHGAPTP